jgi:large subunit ribosomal protein L32
MGALPKRRISTRRKGKRRAVKKISLPKLIKCHKCNKKRLPHQVCPNCGAY